MGHSWQDVERGLWALFLALSTSPQFEICIQLQNDRPVSCVLSISSETPRSSELDRLTSGLLQSLSGLLPDRVRVDFGRVEFVMVQDHLKLVRLVQSLLVSHHEAGKEDKTDKEDQQNKA